MKEKTCMRCNKEFQTRNDSELCYPCTLHSLTGGIAPEEGDFNTAKIQSGTMTDEEFAFLQEDMASVEEGRRIREIDLDFEEWDDPAWCYKCKKDIAFCECICYVCYQYLEECKCTCTLCDEPLPGGGLCAEHLEKWDEDVQGPIPDSRHRVVDCKKCGIPINTHFLLNAPWYPRIQSTAYDTGRDLCMKCDIEGKFDQKK